jgi:hypothetical protein
MLEMLEERRIMAICGVVTVDMRRYEDVGGYDDDSCSGAR